MDGASKTQVKDISGFEMITQNKFTTAQIDRNTWTEEMLDRVFIYGKNLNYISSAAVPEGHGARHLIFSEDGKKLFCANELKSTVSVFDYDNGILSLKDTVSVLPDRYIGESTVAAIRISGKYIYVSKRS